MATKVDHLVIGSFTYVDQVKEAIQDLRAKGYEDFEFFAPLPNHELEDEMYKGKRRSPVRMFTLLGGLTGCLGAFLFTSWMSIDYPIRTSAKTLISVPAFVIVAFECTILLGAIFTLLSMGHFSRIPNPFAKPGFKPHFSNDKFGLAVKVAKDKAGDVEELFSQRGAFEVENKYVR